MVAAEQAKKQLPDFRPGDTIRVHIKVVEGDSERIQVFEGTCLGRRGRGDGASFTVRKMSFGVGVERTFPLFSPHIDKIEVMMSGKVRRAKLYYLRGLSGRAARLTEIDRETTDGTTPAAPAETSVAADDKAAKHQMTTPASETAKPAAPANPAPAHGETGKNQISGKQGKPAAVKAGSTAK